MGAPQPPAVVDAAAPARRPASLGGVTVRWLAWGVVAGTALPLLLVVVGFVWNGFLVYLAVPLMLVGATVGGTVGAIAGSGVAVFARADLGSSKDRPTGYGPAARTRQLTPRPVRTLLVAWLAALAVGWVVSIVYATALSGARLEPAIAVGVAAALVGVALTVAGVTAIPHVRVAAVTAVVIGPLLALGGVLVTIGASWWVATNPVLTISEEQPGPQGSPPDGYTETEALGSSGRIPGPPPLYGDGSLTAANLGSELDEVARYSLIVGPVADDDVSPDTLFPASFVQCPWATEDGMVQATTDIWFDAADDPVAIQHVRDYWVTNGYTLVVDDPDLVVVIGAPGLLGAQYSIERTWDEELRLRMQSVCVRE